MELFDTKEEVKNSTILLVVLGMLISYVITSTDYLITGLFRVIFSLLPLKFIAITSISFRGIIFLALAFILVRVLSSKTYLNNNRTIFLSLKAFRVIGLISILVIALSFILNLYIKQYLGETIELSQIQNTDLTDIAYLSLVQSGLIFMTNITLLIIFFVIVYKKVR